MRISDLEFRRVLFRSRDAGIRVGDDESVVAVVEQTPAVGIAPEILELPAAGRDGARLGVIAARGAQVERAVTLVLGPGEARATIRPVVTVVVDTGWLPFLRSRSGARGSAEWRGGR